VVVVVVSNMQKIKKVKNVNKSYMIF
jgi:hypothetical protein